ncbi:histidine kinase [Gordonia sinesedis]
MRRDRETESADPLLRVRPIVWYLVAVVLGVVQIGGSIGAAEGQAGMRAIDPPGLGLLVVGPLALVVARVRPAPAVLAAGAAAGGWVALGYPYGPVFISYAVLSLVALARGHRWATWSAAAFVGAGQVLRGAIAPDAGWSWLATGWLLAWIVVVLAVAELVRARRERAGAARAARQEALRRRAGEERLLIAQELHDVVAHHMSLINVQAGVALHLADRRPQAVEPALRAIRDASGEGLAELRSLVDVLRADTSPAPRSPTARLAALDTLVDRSRTAGLDVTVDRTGVSGAVPAAVDLAAHRIVQEAITNVVRHAHATHARVSLDGTPDRMTVTVEDDGRGADPDTLVEGNGLLGMRERATALGGVVEVGRSALGGLRVCATIPVREGNSS